MDDDDSPGVPEWVVTYGDMMSLLLTFFIMLVSLSEVVADEKYRAILESMQQFMGYRSGPLAPPGRSFPLNSFVSSLETLGSFTNEDTGRGGVRRPAPQGKDVRVFRTRDGDPVRAGELVPFAPGEADLSPAARAELVKIAAELAGKPNKIDVRAHAAPEPLPAESVWPDKSVLTYRRARAVGQFLERQGIARERLRLTAVGDIEPLPPSGDQRALHHDRVEVLILDEFARGFVGPRQFPE